MQLFDNIEREYLGPADHNEPPYHFYQRSARKDIKIIRDTLNDWFQDYPDSEKAEFRNSFKDHFYDCFFELFLFRLFRQLGFEIEIHPEIPNSSKRPDFLITKEDLEIYIEAKSVYDKSKEEEALERKINQFYDNFSKIKLDGFMLSLNTFDLKSHRQPSSKAAIKYFEEKINQLDPDKLTEDANLNGTESLPSFEFENEDLHIIVKILPLKPSARQKENNRPIGIYPGKSFWGGGEKALRNSIDSKARRYGKLDKPFIICLNSHDIKMSGKEDVENAIWGSLAISWTDNPDDKDEKWVRQKDGVFLNNNGPRLKNVSGVFVTKIFPHNIPIADYWLFEHPFTNNKLDFSKIGLIYSYVDKGKIYTNTIKDFERILNIPNNWLNG